MIFAAIRCLLSSGCPGGLLQWAASTDLASLIQTSALEDSAAANEGVTNKFRVLQEEVRKRSSITFFIFLITF